MKTTATDLRNHLYSYLDKVLETGEPLEIERKGRILRIVSERAPSKISRLKPRDTLIGSVESLLDQEWSHEWNPQGGLADAP
jgi:antitoxin (DNA-binding transcriptional repressor) of toxin-antitoxin stability system